MHGLRFRRQRGRERGHQHRGGARRDCAGRRRGYPAREPRTSPAAPIGVVAGIPRFRRGRMSRSQGAISITDRAITAAMTSKRKFRGFLAVPVRRDTLLPRGHPDPMAGTLRVGDNHRMDPTWIVRLDAPGDGPRLAVKDCIDVEGLPTTVGCELIAEQASPAARDAAVVAAARRAGARIVGKTNLTELCWSASGVNSWSGTPVNPADPG